MFEDVWLQVNRGERIGLIGPNGAGKSTLFALVLGEESVDKGTVTLQRGSSVDFLPPESAPAGEETVLSLASHVSAELAQLQKQLKSGRDNGLVSEADLHAARAHYDDLRGYEIEAKAKRILAGLGFREKDFDRPARELSGGWVMRAHLARLLVQEPDLLLLDEPTNHLDLEALLWFQQYLKTYPGAVLIISHDREFLNQLVGTIIEIRQGRLWRFRGNYDEYLVQRDAQEEQLLAAYKNQQREIARLMQFVERFRAKNTKATQAQSKLKQIERMTLIEAPGPEEAEINFNFPQPARSGRRVVRLQNIHHAYGTIDYLDKMTAWTAQQALANPPKAAAGNDGRPSVRAREQKRIEAQQRQARSRVRREQQQLVHQLEKQIFELEAAQNRLTAELENPVTYETQGGPLQVNRELTHVMGELDR